MKSFFKTLFILVFFFQNDYAQGIVKAPNYDFSLKTFEPLMPGKKFEDIQKLYPKFELINTSKQSKTYKLKVNQLQYVFPVFIQVQESIVIDFFARLPQYFLHDLFHQSLINKLGKQNKYKKVDEHAIYIWDSKDLIHTYEGACTITCFPIYYSVYTKTKEFTPLLKAMNEQEPKGATKNP